MTYFIISSFINALACGLCCIFILVNNYTNKTVRSFALFNCNVALWSFFYFLSMIATHHQEALFYSRILNATALFIPITFLSFIIQITDNKNPYIKFLLYTFLILDILTIPFVTTDLFIERMAQNLIFPFWPVTGPLFNLSIIEYFLIIPISLYLLAYQAFQKDVKNRKDLKILFYTLLIGFAGGGTNFFLCLNIPIVPFGNAFVIAFVVGFIYVVTKYQSMDIKVAISRSFVYAIIIFIITLLYFTVTHLTEIYLNELTGYKSFLFSLLCAAITALAFIPLQNKLQRMIDKLFFNKSVEDIEKENKFLKQEITQTDRLKSVAVLASGMAHEIKNPLTVIKTFSEFLPQKMDDKEFLKKFTPMIAQEVDRINNLVHELLDFAKPALPLLKETNIHSLIQNTVDLLSNQYIKHNIKINTDFRLAPNTTLLLDSNQIKQALLNILLNAIDAMPHGGQLSISTYYSLKDEKINIKIQDSGIGIDNEDMEHIFDPFFSKKDSGTGLGLAITHEIIRKHGGKIYVESVKGKGTSFILEFNR